MDGLVGLVSWFKVSPESPMQIRPELQDPQHELGHPKRMLFVVHSAPLADQCIKHVPNGSTLDFHSLKCTLCDLPVALCCHVHVRTLGFQLLFLTCEVGNGDVGQRSHKRDARQHPAFAKPRDVVKARLRTLIIIGDSVPKDDLGGIIRATGCPSHSHNRGPG